MFQTFISRHNSNFFSDKLVLTSVTPASSAPVLQTPKATSSTLYFDSLTVNAGNGGFLHCIQMDTSVNAANQVVSVGADIAFDADPKFFACLVRFESSSVPTTLPTAYDVYPLDGRHDGGYYTVKDCVTIDVLPRTPGNNVYVGFMVWSNFTATKCRGLVSLNQVIKEIEKTVTQFCRKLAAERPLKDIRDEYNYPKKKGIKDECSRLLEASTMKSRRGFAIQRLMNAMRQAHADGWFIVFDTLTLADDRLEAFYDNPNALRDYFRDIGRMVLAAEGRKANDSHADCYQYFCVPEYGTANGRLHFHAVHFMRTLPTGSVDPNFGRRVRNRRQLNSLQNTWPYGYSMPIAVRYTQDAFSRSGWLWPVDAKGEPLKATSYMAVGFYVAKYVNKKSDMDLAAKGLGAKEWNNSLKTKLSLLPKKLFRIRMSRNFGMKMLTMTNLSTECLIQLTKLGYDATPFNQILKQNAKREMRLRLGKVTVADVLAAQPVTTNLLKFMRASIKMIGVSNLQSFIASMTQKLTLSDISDESKNYLDKAGITTACLRIKSKWTAGGK